MDLDDVITLADGANELGIAAVTFRAAVSRGRRRPQGGQLVNHDPSGTCSIPR